MGSLSLYFLFFYINDYLCLGSIKENMLVQHVRFSACFSVSSSCFGSWFKEELRANVPLKMQPCPTEMFKDKRDLVLLKLADEMVSEMRKGNLTISAWNLRKVYNSASFQWRKSSSMSSMRQVMQIGLIQVICKGSSIISTNIFFSPKFEKLVVYQIQKHEALNTTT